MKKLPPDIHAAVQIAERYVKHSLERFTTYEVKSPTGNTELIIMKGECRALDVLMDEYGIPRAFQTLEDAIQSSGLMMEFRENSMG